MLYFIYSIYVANFKIKEIGQIWRNTGTLHNTYYRELNAKRVELAFDRESNLMRIKGVTEGGLEIKKTKMFGKGFYNQFNIIKKGKFEARFDSEQKALFVQL